MCQSDKISCLTMMLFSALITQTAFGQTPSPTGSTSVSDTFGQQGAGFYYETTVIFTYKNTSPPMSQSHNVKVEIYQDLGGGVLGNLLADDAKAAGTTNALNPGTATAIVRRSSPGQLVIRTLIYEAGTGLIVYEERSRRNVATGTTTPLTPPYP